MKVLLIALLLTEGTGGHARSVTAQRCGRSLYHEEHTRAYAKGKRIVGGQESMSGEWPWLVSLMLMKNGTSGYSHTCGGTLISPQWVISAAHCFEPVWVDFLSADPEAWMVRIGEHDLFDEKTNHIDVQPSNILFHPLRNAPQTYNLDIVLIKLSQPVGLDSHVNIACLPTEQDIPEAGTMCITAGWGFQQEMGNISNTVRHVQVPVVSNRLCNKLYAKLAQIIKLEIPSDMMCAGFAFGGHDACQFDSGGPLVCFDNVAGDWLLTGVVSIGYGCARAGFPGIYTRVPMFIDWIKETIRNN